MAAAIDKKRKLVIIVALLFLTGGIAGGGWWWYRSTRFVSTDDARVDGTIVSVSAKIPGKVIEVLVKEGDEVAVGQEMAQLDTRDLAAQKKKAAAALTLAQAKYEKLVVGLRPQEIGVAQADADRTAATLADAYKNYLRVEKLYQDGAASASQRDHAEARYLEAKEAANLNIQKLDLAVVGSRIEDIQAAAAEVQQAEANLEAVAINIEDAVISSPVKGIVALKSVNPGEVVNVGQGMFSVVDFQDIWLNARIKETEIGKIKLGQKVEYTVDGYPGRTFSGSIFEIGNATGSTFALLPAENAAGNFTKITQRVPIKISLPLTTEGVVFRPGMQALIDIQVK